MAVASTDDEDDALSVVRQMDGIKAGLASIDGVGEGEQAGDVGVAPPGLGEEGNAESSSIVNSPPVMGLTPRLLARRANSSAPQRLVSVRASVS